MNAVWDYLRDIAEAAKSIYRDDYAKYNQYLLPGKSNNPEENYNVLITVKDANTSALLEGAKGDFTGLGVDAISGSDGIIPFADIPDGTHDLEVSLEGYVLQSTSVDVVEGETLEIEILLQPE